MTPRGVRGTRACTVCILIINEDQSPGRKIYLLTHRVEPCSKPV